MARQLDVRWIWLNLGSRSKARFKKSPHSISTMDDDDDDDRHRAELHWSEWTQPVFSSSRAWKVRGFYDGQRKKSRGRVKEGALKKDR